MRHSENVIKKTKAYTSISLLTNVVLQLLLSTWMQDTAWILLVRREQSAGMIIEPRETTHPIKE